MEGRGSIILVGECWFHPPVQRRLVPSLHTVRKETNKFRKMDVASKAQYVIETGHLWPKLLASVLEATHDRALAERKIRRAAELRAIKANKTTNGEESWNAVKGGTAWPFAIPLPSSFSTSKTKKETKKNKEKKKDRAPALAEVKNTTRTAFSGSRAS